MPRIRSIKPEFWDSPDTARADLRTRLLFMAMWNWADDYGVGDATPGRLVNFAFPNDGIPVADFPCMLSDVSKSYEVVFFTFHNRPFYVIPSWDAHQRNERRAKVKVDLYDAADAAIAAARTDIAERPTNCAEIPCNCAELQALEQGNRGTGELGTGEQGKSVSASSATNGHLVSVPAPEAPAKPAPKRKQGTRLPEGWMPQQHTIDAIKARFPHVTSDQIQMEHEQFSDWAASCTTRAATKADWDAAWRTWMRRELPKVAGTTTSKTDRGIAETQALKQLYAQGELA